MCVHCLSVIPGMYSLECGFVCHGDYSPKPKVDLQKVEVNCSVTDFTACVRTTCTYKSNIDEPIEGSYVFPLNNVAFFSFEARIEDRTIVAECRPRGEVST